MTVPNHVFKHGFFDRVNATGFPVTTFIIQDCIAFFNRWVVMMVLTIFVYGDARSVEWPIRYNDNHCGDHRRNRRASIGACADRICMRDGWDGSPL